MAQRARWIFVSFLLGLFLFGPGLWELIRLSRIERQLGDRLAELSQERELLLLEEHRLRNDPTYLQGLRHTTFKETTADEYTIHLPEFSDVRSQKPKKEGER